MFSGKLVFLGGSARIPPTCIVNLLLMRRYCPTACRASPKYFRAYDSVSTTTLGRASTTGVPISQRKLNIWKNSGPTINPSYCSENLLA